MKQWIDVISKEHKEYCLNEELDQVLFDIDFSENELENLIPYFDERCWNIISEHQKLSEAFILKHKDNICWDLIWNQDLSEKFTKDNIHLVNWYNLSCSNNLKKYSIEFLKEHEGSIYWTYVKGIERKII